MNEQSQLSDIRFFADIRRTDYWIYPQKTTGHEHFIKGEGRAENGAPFWTLALSFSFFPNYAVQSRLHFLCRFLIGWGRSTDLTASSNT